MALSGGIIDVPAAFLLGTVSMDVIAAKGAAVSGADVAVYMSWNDGVGNWQS